MFICFFILLVKNISLSRCVVDSRLKRGELLYVILATLADLVTLFNDCGLSHWICWEFSAQLLTSESHASIRPLGIKRDVRTTA